MSTSQFILDIGCGSAEPIGRYFVESGCDVTGVDSSPELISLSKEHFPRQTWQVADMRQGVAPLGHVGGRPALQVAVGKSRKLMKQCHPQPHFEAAARASSFQAAADDAQGEVVQDLPRGGRAPPGRFGRAAPPEGRSRPGPFSKRGLAPGRAVRSPKAERSLRKAKHHS